MTWTLGKFVLHVLTLGDYDPRDRKKAKPAKGRSVQHKRKKARAKARGQRAATPIPRPRFDSDFVDLVSALRNNGYKPKVAAAAAHRSKGANFSERLRDAFRLARTLSGGKA